MSELDKITNLTEVQKLQVQTLMIDILRESLETGKNFSEVTTVYLKRVSEL